MSYTQDQLKKLADDGVDTNLLQQNAAYFETCPTCKVQFTKDCPHTLLKCGHVCCGQCYNAGIICGYCKECKNVRTKDYRGLLACQQVSDKANSQVFYDVCLQITTNNKAKYLSKIPSSTTFEKLLSMSDDFKAYEQKLNDRVGIVIRSKHFHYNTIKQHCLAQYSHTLSTNCVNMIAILDMFLGGKYSE